MGVGVVAALALAQQVGEKLGLRSDASILLILVVGFVGFLSQRLLALTSRQRKQEEIDDTMMGALVAWPPPKASEIEIFDLGVYPPVSDDRNPPYVKRDVDDALSDVLAEAAFVVVYGPPRSGKSRTALEALSEETRVLAPQDADRLGSLVSQHPEQHVGPGGAVLWLDKLERFLSNLPLNTLNLVTDRRSLFQVLATVDEKVLWRLTREGGNDAHTLRRLVARSTLIRLPGTLSAKELADALSLYPSLDFTRGFESAFSVTWEDPRTLQEPAAIPSVGLTFWERLDARLSHIRGLAHERKLLSELWHSIQSLWLRLSGMDTLALFLGVAVVSVVIWTTVIGLREGLITPPSIASQLSAIGERLKSCRIAFSTSDATAIEKGEPLVVTTNPLSPCTDRADARQPVLVYTVSHGWLERSYAFGPPGEPSAHDLSTADFSFECRGTDPNDKCWTDMTGNGDSAIIGGFYSRFSKVTFPVIVAEINGKFEATPLLKKRPSIERRFRDGAYTKPFKLEPSGPAGYYVYDFAVVEAPSEDRELPAVRFVAGFVPPGEKDAPNSLQVRAFVLGMSKQQRPVLSKNCSSVHLNKDIVMSVGEHDPRTLLATRWRQLEGGRVRAVCY